MNPQCEKPVYPQMYPQNILRILCTEKICGVFSNSYFVISYRFIATYNYDSLLIIKGLGK